MTVKLTPAGRQAVWAWVQAVAREPETQSPEGWYQSAEHSINLADYDEELVVWMRGSLSRRGHLEALRLKPEWYHRPARYRVELPALS